MSKKESVISGIRGVFPWCFEKYTPKKNTHVIKNDLRKRDFFHLRFFEFLEKGPFNRELRGRSMNSKSAGYPRFRLFTPNPPDFFPLGCSLTKKNPANPLASMLAD